MFWINLALNCLLFLVVINLGNFFRNRSYGHSESGYVIVYPLILGCALTILDSMRLAFFQQLVLFIAVAVVAYWFISVFLKK